MSLREKSKIVENINNEGDQCKTNCSEEDSFLGLYPSYALSDFLLKKGKLGQTGIWKDNSEVYLYNFKISYPHRQKNMTLAVLYQMLYSTNPSTHT